VLRQFRLVLAAAAALLAGSALAQSPAPAQAAPVTILHINDVHEMDSAEGGRVGGLARVATLTRRLRRTNPDARYRVALPEFLLTGGESRLGFLTRTNPRVHDVEDRRDIRQAVIDELGRRPR
jgi:hypothetical protein